MIRRTGKRPARVLAEFMCAGLLVAWAVAQGAAKQRDQREIAHMMADAKTVCVGRFLIDLPATAQVELSKERIDGFDIYTLEESREQFLVRLANREKAIASTPDRHGGLHNLESVQEVTTASGMQGKIFMHSRTGGEVPQNGYPRYEGDDEEGMSAEAMLHGQGITLILAAKDLRLDVVAGLPRIAQLVVPNPGNTPPSEAGFCVDKAYFRDPIYADQNETLMMSASLPTHPDIVFHLLMHGGLKPTDKGLIARRAESPVTQAMLSRLWLKVLRLAPREIDGLVGDEVAERYIEANDTIGYVYRWEVLGKHEDVLEPSLSFMMMTGAGRYEQLPSSLSEDAATALWDRIASSLRRRPVQASQGEVAAAPKVALGVSAMAGETCIQGGWWTCSDVANGFGVLGGRRRYIVHGERMPQALLLPAPSLWQRIRGLQPSIESDSPTSWTLADKRERDRGAPAFTLASAAAGVVVEGVEVVPVGTVASTGQVCGASGWWRCEDPNAIDGTRWFSHGSVLPSATIAGPERHLPLLSSRPAPSIRRCNWQLVRSAASALVQGSECEAAGAATNPPRPVA